MKVVELYLRSRNRIKRVLELSGEMEHLLGPLYATSANSFFESLSCLIFSAQLISFRSKFNICA